MQEGFVEVRNMCPTKLTLQSELLEWLIVNLTDTEMKACVF